MDEMKAAEEERLRIQREEEEAAAAAAAQRRRKGGGRRRGSEEPSLSRRRRRRGRGRYHTNGNESSPRDRPFARTSAAPETPFSETPFPRRYNISQPLGTARCSLGSDPSTDAFRLSMFLRRVVDVCSASLAHVSRRLAVSGALPVSSSRSRYLVVEQAPLEILSHGEGGEVCPDRS